jgi:hypothetical protein
MQLRCVMLSHNVLGACLGVERACVLRLNCCVGELSMLDSSFYLVCCVCAELLSLHLHVGMMLCLLVHDS